MTLVVLAPLRIEALALRGLDVRRTGMGGREAGSLGGDDLAVVAGFCGAAELRLRSGDVIVANELRSSEGTIACPPTDRLLIALEREGLRIRVGPIHSADHVAGREERSRLARDGVVAVDMESYWLAESLGARLAGVVRVVVDEAGTRLLHPRTLPAGVRAFRSLRRAGAALQPALGVAPVATTTLRA